jgi:uncharacterized protein (DUF58 family)
MNRGFIKRFSLKRFSMKRFWYRRFRAMTSLQRRWGRLFTGAGLLVLGGLGGSAAVGLDMSRTVSYQVFTFLFAVVVLSVVGSLGFRARLGARRVLPRFATAGEPVTYRLVLRNDGETSQRGLVVSDDLADPRPSFEEFARAREPGEERRNWFDRRVGWYRWTWLIARHPVVAPRAVPAVPPRGEAELRVALTPRRRGCVRFTGVTVARADPLGLTNALMEIPLPQTLLVLPRRYPVPRLPLPGTRRYQPGGVTFASSVGESDEFASLRDYRPGDPPRRIHWKSFARAGRPVVKEYQDEFFVRHALVLDTFAAEESDVFEEAVSVAASLACSLETQDALLDLTFVGPEAYVVTAGRGLGHMDQMLEVLATVAPCRDRPFVTLQRAVLEREASLSGCLCVLLGWDEPRRDLVRQLRARGLPTRAFVISPPATGDAGEAWFGGTDVHRLTVGRVAEDLARL